MKIIDASHLTDSELVVEVGRLACGEREATVALIAHLAEFDARRLYEAAGFSSTFRYCLEVLRLSEDAAFNRIEAARCARRYPVVLEMLTTGALSPTTARHIPAAVRRAVWGRDGGRCTFVSAGGRRYSECRGLEFHHVLAHGAGGPPTVDNIRLLCRAHNRHEAALFYEAGRDRGEGVVCEGAAPVPERVRGSKLERGNEPLDTSQGPRRDRGAGFVGALALPFPDRHLHVPGDLGLRSGEARCKEATAARDDPW